MASGVVSNMRSSASRAVKSPVMPWVRTPRTRGAEYTISTPACCAARLSVVIASPAGISNRLRAASPFASGAAAAMATSPNATNRPQSHAVRRDEREAANESMGHGETPWCLPRRLMDEFTLRPFCIPCDFCAARPNAAAIHFILQPLPSADHEGDGESIHPRKHYQRRRRRMISLAPGRSALTSTVASSSRTNPSTLSERMDATIGTPCSASSARMI